MVLVRKNLDSIKFDQFSFNYFKKATYGCYFTIIFMTFDSINIFIILS